MVLRDISILKMTLEQLTDVLRPKIQGGLHLDRLFATTDLDFFVLVSKKKRLKFRYIIVYLTTRSATYDA